MTYELRKLKSSDLGIVCKILSGIGIKEFKTCFNIQDFKNSKNPEQVGMNVVFDIGGIIIENIPKVQKDIDLFISSLTGQDIQQIHDMDFAEYGSLIIEIVAKEEFKDFFRHVMKLLNP